MAPTPDVSVEPRRMQFARMAWVGGGWLVLLAGVLSTCAVGCGRPVPPYPKGFESDDPIVRSRTIQMAADRRDREAVPLLVNRLEDEDEGVRLFAIVALDKITGERLGYNYADSVLQRARAVKRWRAYLETLDNPATRPAVGDSRTAP